MNIDTTNFVATFEGLGDTTVEVVAINRGYSVGVRDNDSGEKFPTLKIYKDKAVAIASAQNIAAGRA